MPRGRPVDQGKLHLILDKAREQAVAHGWGGLSLEGVAAAAGVSKVTIYSRFGDRAGLIAALVGRESERMEEGLGRLRFAGDAFTAGLVSFGSDFILFWGRPDTRLFDALITLAAQGEHRRLAAAFVQSGPLRLRAAIAAKLGEGQQRGLIDVPDAAQAAEDLIALWQASIPPEQRFGLGTAPEPEQIRAGVAQATTTFLRAYGPSRQPSASSP